MALTGKVVLVTGAARGMGREYVRGFRKAGARIIATDLSWAPSGASSDDAAFLDEIKGDPDVLAESMDITIDAHVKRVFDASIKKFGTVDAIVNNAGMRQRDLYPPHGSVTTLETEVGDWQRMFDTHVFGTLRVVKAFSAPMLAQRRGSIVSVSSGGYAAARPESREMPYQAAKAALTTMTLYLAHELAAHNIAANVVLPGHTRTTGSDEQEAIRRRIREQLGIRRRTLRLVPEHVVPLALFLAEQDAGRITGQVINAMEWNEKNGFGGADRWAYPPDRESATTA
jgi:1,1a-dihydroxy-1-hydro-9-fluorenone dehydrogenase